MTSPNDPHAQKVFHEAGGNVMAHEMGHYMSLCTLDSHGAARQFHSTGDSDGGDQVRDDSITRRRVMYPMVTLKDAGPHTWRNDTGYGPHHVGALITHRMLPDAQDFTFQESQRARDSIRTNFYAF